MTSRIDISAPATINLLGTLEAALPPGTISLSDPANGTITVTIAAANAGAALSASSAGGAMISSNGNIAIITGVQSQVNAALASLEITEPAKATTDTIIISATDPAALPGQTAIAVNIASTVGPAFAAPPATMSLGAYSLSALSGLVLGDPQATALAAGGLGTSETLQITLAVASGILLLPGVSSLSGVSASGIGTGNILLTFTADQLAAVNTLLAGLVYAAPAAASGLAYGMRNIAGPLNAASTSGNIVLKISGTTHPASIVSSGADTAILGAENLGAGATLTISGVTSDLGGITGAAALNITPDGVFTAPYNTIALGGTSLDFGTLTAGALNESGALFIADGAVFGGPVNLGSTGLIDFTGTLEAAAQAQNLNQLAVSLAAGAIITGSGTLLAGNFSEAGVIAGPGTILAGGGETLVINAGSITGGTQLDVAPGGVMELGPLNPLFGVFNATPLTIGAGTTLGFLGQSGGQPATGIFADTLAQAGGVFVINSPGLFAGTITGFAPGDRLIFPGLTGLTLLGITANSFIVAGQDSNDITQSYTINAAIPSGTQLYVGTDAEGDGEVSLRDAQPDIFINGITASVYAIIAKTGTAQPIQALEILPQYWTTQALTLTLAAGAGVLSDPGFATATSLTITASSPTALEADLAGLAYTGNTGATLDTLLITSSSGLLAGLEALIPIYLNTLAGTLGGFNDSGFAALFSGVNTLAFGGAAAPGEIVITAGEAVFGDQLAVGGISGTALVIDGGALGIFDAGANAALAAGVTIGDATGAGQLDILTNAFSVAGKVLLASGGADVSGALTIAGSLALAGQGAENFQLQGALTAPSLSIGTAGTFTATGTARAAFAALTDSGTLSLFDTAAITAAAASIAGTLALGGSARLDVQNGLTSSGYIAIGPDAALLAETLSQPSGSISLAGLLELANGLAFAGSINLAGGTLIAPTIALRSSALLTGFGTLEAAAGLGTLVLAGGNINASGALLLDENISLSNGATIGIAASAALDAAHAITGGSVDFSGGSAELTINDLAQFKSQVLNMLDHDAIDLIGIAPSLVTFAAGSISARDTSGNAIGGFLLSIATGQPSLSITSDGHGGTLLTLNGDMPCFARGTRLLTPDGYRPVEVFKPGDPVITQGGASRAIRWIGRRTLDLAAADASPVRFAPNALAPGVPKRPVLLSPLHAVFINGLLVPAMHLVNGATITRPPAAAVTYFHIELDHHDVVLADGMAVETYLDTGNRGQLYQEQGVRGVLGPPCAPLVTSGPRLATIRHKLHGIALDAGFSLTYYPALRGAAAQTSLLPRIKMQNGRRIARFTLPPSAQNLALAARSAAPAETNPDSEDRRNLGICLEEIFVHDHTLPLGPHLGPGWHRRAPDDIGTWMGGAGALLNLPPGLGAITLSLSAIIQSWQPPQLDLNLPPA